MLNSIDLCFDEWLPRLREGEWKPIPQNERLATYFGKRTIRDGWINWQYSSDEIYTLVRASSRPHPGAYTYFHDNRIIIFRARPYRNLKITAGVGVVVQIIQDEPVVQCGSGHLLLEDFEIVNVCGDKRRRHFKVGQTLGYLVEDELFKLINRPNNR